MGRRRSGIEKWIEEANEAYIQARYLLEDEFSIAKDDPQRYAADLGIREKLTPSEWECVREKLDSGWPELWEIDNVGKALLKAKKRRRTWENAKYDQEVQDKVAMIMTRAFENAIRFCRE